MTLGTLSRPRITYTGDGFQEVFAPELFLEGNVGGVTRYGFTPIEPEPLIAESIVAQADPIVIELGQTTQVSVTATVSDGSQVDITAREFGTTYQSSNPDIATVTWSRDGRYIAYTTVKNLPPIDPEFGTIYETSDVWVIDADGGSRVRLPVAGWSGP